MEAKSFLRNVGMFLLHTLLAVLGAAVVESSLDKFIHVRTAPAIILRTFGFSVVLPVLIAFFAFDRLRSDAAKWVWVLPALFFALGISAFTNTRPPGVLGETVWARFSGHTCGITLDPTACRYFFLFTIPFVRSIFYTAGILLRTTIKRGKIEPTESVQNLGNAVKPEKAGA